MSGNVLIREQSLNRKNSRNKTWEVDHYLKFMQYEWMQYARNECNMPDQRESEIV